MPAEPAFLSEMRDCMVNLIADAQVAASEVQATTSRALDRVCRNFGGHTAYFPQRTNAPDRGLSSATGAAMLQQIESDLALDLVQSGASDDLEAARISADVRAELATRLAGMICYIPLGARNAALARALHAYDLYVSGQSKTEIAMSLSMSVQGVSKMIRRAEQHHKGSGR
ncbi:hypothetical protein JY409_08500 [Stenotrophomonas maltophilia]|nr:hypothetical protein [Stenotrophomonas maltophilia]